MSAQHEDGRITAGELTKVCAHYDLGTVRHVSRLKAGSRSAPKVVLITDRGAFLLKRRAPGHASNPRTVALTHEVMLHLEGSGLPAPELVGTIVGNNSMLQLEGRVYEVYRFIQGRPYDRSTDDADDAGSLLARLHRVLAELRTRWPAPRGGFHAQPNVAPGLRSLAQRFASEPPDEAEMLRRVCQDLADRYEHAAGSAEALGVGGRDVQLIHADWHPGNVLFRESAPTTPTTARGRRTAAATVAKTDPSTRVAAILDFDSLRIAPRLTDLVNGSMQFALGRAPAADGESAGWRIGIDQHLLAAFYRGYRRESGLALTPEEARAVPDLMIEALIVEAAAPIAATGRFGRLGPLPILQVVDRATRQIAAATPGLVSLVTSP